MASLTGIGEGGERVPPRPAARRRPIGARETSSRWPSDIAFLARLGIAPAVLDDACARAARLGIAPADALVCAGAIGETTYFQALAGSLGLPFLDADRLAAAARPGMVPAAAIRHGRLVGLAGGVTGRGAATAPLGPEVDDLRRLLAEKPHLARQIAIATPSSIRTVLTAAAGESLTASAREGLARRFPEMSALAVLTRLQRLALAGTLGLVAAAGIVFPGAMLVLLNIVLTLVFLAVVAVRILAVMKPQMRERRAARAPDEALPVYSVLVPLYREGAMVAGLVAALGRLDYPPERLDIKLVVEADDAETRGAIAALGIGPPFEVVVVPPSQPRTKPKALAFALPLVRGDFVVVYDAEDRPDPDQLRVALAAFWRGGPKLGCVQGRLDIDPEGGWIAGQFLAEYAGQFHVLLPFLAMMRLPLPLGGTSNHFRREVLERIGGWDPFNVTEDADIGQRLARFGYRAAVIASATRETAPGSFGVWLRQRTRWMKGWMQTYLVHMRRPRRLLADLNPAGFLALQVMVGGMVLSALVHPVFLVAGVVVLAGLADLVAANGVFGRVLLGIDAFNLVAGYAGAIAVAAVGLERRRAGRLVGRLVTLPVYWVLISLAAYRAVYQLWRDPFLWEKTPHEPTSQGDDTVRSRASGRGGSRH
ncbi:MAG TPA: glycosyltransferase [Hyphomicrobiales bacterium]|nr:glycosyltransferase [Kaistiaceae bacterium]HQF29984.1 glycosyltransferase [Hyphomicrobiales bacterium]